MPENLVVATDGSLDAFFRHENVALPRFHDSYFIYSPLRRTMRIKCVEKPGLFEINRGVKMSIESAKAFRKHVDLHPEIHEEVKAACLGNGDLGEIGARHGFDFTDSEARTVMSEMDVSGELSDFELNMVAGGCDVCS